ncbi:MAG: TolC family protein [Candidatus Aminicenantes bacterium]|nr:TolC family protein [Candidatus Aminicenantes bacterium]
MPKSSIVRFTRAAGVAALLTVAVGLSPATARSDKEFLTLEKALETAFRNSPNMQDARYRLETSRQNLMAQQAGLKSQFNLSLTPINVSNAKNFNDLTSQYIYTSATKSSARFSITQPIRWTDGTLTMSNQFIWQEASSAYTGNIKTTTFNNSLSLRFNQPLFTYNRTEMQIRELELSLENAQINYALQKLSIEKQVTQQFLNLYYTLEGVKIAEEELKNSTESYEIIQNKVQAGISAQGELYQADLTRLNSQAGLENKQIQYANALDQFKILIGLPLSTEIEAVTDIRKNLVAVDLIQAVAHGLDNRMELRQKDISIANAMHDLTRAAATNEFKASIDLQLGLTGINDQFNTMYESANTDTLVALTLNVPLFDWGQKTHLIAAGQAQVDSQKLSFQEQRKSIEAEIRQAFRSLRNLERQIEIAEKNVRNAQLTYEINLERYKNGDLSSKDMQFYQLQLSEQRLNVVSALINYKLALLDLKIRSLWDFETGRPIVDAIEPA